MTEDQKLIVEIAARLLVARVDKEGWSRDITNAHNAVVLARTIVEGAKK